MNYASRLFARVIPMPTSVSPKARKGFDYASLDTETSQFVQQQTGEIRVLMKRTAQGIVEIGQKLIEVKERLGHGRFLNWLAAEFEWTDETARRFMNVAQQFGHNPQIVGFAPSALYVLAAPSIPEAAREEAIARAKAGESITYTAAKAIKQKYATPPIKPKPESKPEPELASSPQLTPTPALPSQSVSKLEIVAIHRQALPSPLPDATRVMPVSQTVPSPLPIPTLPAPLPSQSVDEPGVWWQLSGRHLLYSGNPNSSEFLARVAEETEKLSLLLAFPPTTDWLPAIGATARLIIENLPQGKDQAKDLRLFEDTLESILLLYSHLDDLVVSCFLPLPEILSIINRLDRRGLFAEPDSRRFNAVISDWKRAGLKVELMS